MKVLFVDLDNTVIFSRKKLNDGVCVEELKGEPVSFMTANAVELYSKAAREIVIVPVTTRSAAQFCRVRLPVSPKYAIAANGGILFNDGVIDREWNEFAMAEVESCKCALDEAYKIMGEYRGLLLGPRRDDGLFVFCKAEQPEILMEQLKSSLCGDVLIEYFGQKMYVFPSQLNKGNAVRMLSKRLEASFTISAGDSSLDFSMLNSTDECFAPDSLKGMLENQNVNWYSGESSGFTEFILKGLNNFI